MTALAEWCARTYGWTLRHILWELPAVQVALLLRQWRFAVAGSQAVTLMEEEAWRERAVAQGAGSNEQ